MNKRANPFGLAFWSLTLAGLLAVALLFFVSPNRLWFYIACSLWLVAAILCCVNVLSVRKNTRHILESLRETLTGDQGLTQFPMAVMVVNDEMEVVWYNDHCRDLVFRGIPFTSRLSDLLPGVSLEKECPPEGYSTVVGGRMYTVFVARAKEQNRFIIYFVDDNELKTYAAEYFNSRPSVLLLLIDNYDELFQNLRENEKSQITGQIEQLVEQFVEEAGGLLRKLHKDQYIAIIEERYMRGIIENRFPILDRVRALTLSGRTSPTMSIGIGQDVPTFHEAEMIARQALDMALGRGGDQAALKTKNGYEFFGGVSRTVEKRNKVRTRIVANALTELIKTSDKVVIMGHRVGDLDSLGAAVGFAKITSQLGRRPIIAVNRQKSLAEPLYARLLQAGYQHILMSPAQALEEATKNTLLIIVDTHIANLVESPELLARCPNVVVVDHHRKMVGHIENAVIFYHEPYASSASEMAAEICQYIGDGNIASVEAEALLAGMMLDTKSFTIRTGVRTFEAAAYLRRMGADTVAVRHLFSTSMDAYQHRSRIVASAELYRACAIAVTEDDLEGMQVVAPQSADELLTISGVDASFVVYRSGARACVSARSMGAINVQVLMEKLGGGGHHTMAGVQKENTTLTEMRGQLIQAIDAYIEEQNKSKQLQNNA